MSDRRRPSRPPAGRRQEQAAAPTARRRRLVISLVTTVVVAWGSMAALAATGTTPKLGLDLAGGTSVVLTAPDGTDAGVLDRAVGVMRNRIEALGGVQEPVIQVSGANTVLVQLPGVTDRERALDAIGTTGLLSFRPVLGEVLIPPPGTETTTTTVPGETTTTGAGETTTTAPAETTTTTTAGETTTTVAGETTTTVPAETTTTTLPEPTQPLDDNPAEPAVLAVPGSDVLYYQVDKAFLEGSDVANAQPVYNQGSLAWVVDVTFTGEGATKFEEATRALSFYPVGDPRRQMAIVLDGEVISAPQLSETIPSGQGIAGGSAVITLGGAENQQQEARDLSIVLRYGALPVAFERSQVQSVSATLGSDSLRAGLVAGIGGLVLVAVAMVLYYRILGLVAVLGLTVFGSLLVGIFSILGSTQGLTLTLAGVAGIIVSVGITSDSYIVYFERIKEEVRGGRSIRAAVDDGFARALRTILTADTVSFSAAVLLYYLAIGPVKGFALALGLATIIDVFVAYFFTRAAVGLLSRSRLAEEGFLSIRAACGLGSAPQEVPA